MPLFRLLFCRFAVPDEILLFGQAKITYSLNIRYAIGISARWTDQPKVGEISLVPFNQAFLCLSQVNKMFFFTIPGPGE